MQTIYRADDGTEFNSEIECRRYELDTKPGAHPTFMTTLRQVLEPVVSNDDRGNDVIFVDNDDELSNNLRSLSVVICHNLDKLVQARDSIILPRRAVPVTATPKATSSVVKIKPRRSRK